MSLRLNKKIMYTLGRHMGQDVALYKHVSDTQDIATGVVQRTFNIYYLKQVIIGQTKELRKSGILPPNFKYGGYLDATRRVIYLNKDYEITINDEFVFDEKRWSIKEISEAEENNSYVIIVENIENREVYDAAVQSMIDNSWEGDFKTKIALDKLARTIRNTVFSGIIPSNLLVWPCCGKTIDDSIYCLHHPIDNLTNVGFTADDFKNRGIDGGLQSATTEYLKTDWVLKTQASYDDLHISVYAYNIDYTDTGAIIGANNDCSISISAGGKIVIDVLGTIILTTTDLYGLISLNSESASLLKAYINGVYSDQNTSTRSGALPTMEAYVSAINNAGVPDEYTNIGISFIVMCSKLTATQIAKLYTAISVFNQDLGRYYE